jgi:bifunctional isochorismate lyase/aryl carrier protein
MPVPRIQSYELPHTSILPPSRAPFRLQPERAALLIHDVQDYFLEPFDRSAAPLAPALSNIASLRTLCSRFEIPVFFSAQPGEQDRSQRGLLWDL